VLASNLSKGLELIPEPWHTDHYSVTLQLSDLCAKCLYNCGKFDQSTTKAEEIVDNATNSRDKTADFLLIVDSLNSIHQQITIQVISALGMYGIDCIDGDLRS